MTQVLAGKVALVTGAASGIGLGTVEAMVAAGARVVACDIQDEKGAMLGARFPDTVVYRRCDVTREDDIAAAVAEAQAAFGGLDIAFNNAGAAGAMMPTLELGLDDWRRAIDLLLTSVFLGVKHAAPAMMSRGGGAIINTASIAGLQAGFGPIAYSTAKAGVIGFTRCAAAELSPHGVRVNAICPGLIATSIFGGALGLPVEQADQLAAQIVETAKNTQPIGRSGLPADIAAMVVHLASDAGGFITGQHFVIDGGITVGPRHAWDAGSPAPLAQAVLSAFEANAGGGSQP
jgi:NAD(P)-dependent dehydrogenase (short-subunit alcohol dehydrogenase family)